MLVRPGKIVSLFPISHFLDFEAGGRSLFIIHYAKLNIFTGKILKITKGMKSRVNKRAWHIERVKVKVEAVGC